MGNISNDFVTIEYNSEEQKQIAEYYMNLFNTEPEYFKGILNGRNTIQDNELLSITDNDEINRSNIIHQILANNNAVCDLFCNTTPTLEGVYYAMMTYFHGVPDEVDKKIIYHEVAYDYLRLTGDFSYLRKYYFEGSIDKDDIRNMCMYEIEHRYEEFIKIKIEDSKRRPGYPKIKESLKNIRRITDEIDALTGGIIREVHNRDNTVPSPKIDEKEFEELVIGALKYIDPSNKLVEEYLNAKNNNLINLVYGEKNGNSMYCEKTRRIGEEPEQEIKVCMTGTLIDVQTMLHEFGHYYYRIDNRETKKNNILFREYPSIYFEQKAIEYLENVGYTKEQLRESILYRMLETKRNISNFLPSLYCLEYNNDTLTGEYHTKEVDEYAKKYWEREYKRQVESSSPSARKRLLSALLFFDRLRTLNTLDDDELNLTYIIGTYFTMYSIQYLKHEDILKILDYIKNNEVDMSKVEELHGMIDEKQQENETNKLI